MVDLKKNLVKEKAKEENVSEDKVVPTKGLQKILKKFMKDLMDDNTTTDNQKHKLARLRAYIDINFKKGF